MIRNAIKLGSFRGIQIGLDLSWLLIFAWVTWSLATYHFPMDYPAWRPGGYWMVAVVTSLLFFGSILAHELGHSLVALRFGIPVRSITLFLFGGVAQITQEPKRAREEFYIAIAGPLVSVALAGFFWGLSLLVAPGSPLAALGGWLGIINLSLAVFNLIPGFPLDGGRVLRAAVWGLTGNYRRATRWASAIGQFVAYGFIGLGVGLAVVGSLWNGLWLVFIGWFLLNAASASWRQASLRGPLQGLVAQDVMMTDCPHLKRDLTLDELVHTHVLHTEQRCFPVTEGNHIIGMITLDEIKAVPQARWAQVTVAEAMLPFKQALKVLPTAELSQVLAQMNANQINQLPVMETDHLLGMISREGIFRVLKIRLELKV